MSRGCVGLVVWLGTCAALGQAPQAHVRAGNAHYAAGQYAQALAEYEKAGAALAGPAPELLHNRAAAHFKLGDRQAARDLWVQLKESADARLEARTLYNLGNCDYADALEPAAAPDAALKLLAQAARQYREALKLDPGLVDARANLELTELLRRQLEQQQEQQPQSQPSSQPQSQPSSQPQSQPSSQPQSQPSSQPASQPGQQGEQGEPQEREAQQSEDERQSPQGEQEQRPEEEPQPEPGAEQETPPPETQPAQTQPAGDPNVPEGQMSREQAARLLQMIRDAEKARRERLMQQRMQKQPPVERDW